ncbi:MAG: T9SS type A sorting domain-containing protein [Candidatus Eisenbacteria bacterium]|nr:T9SS type A sorting domain-containing protein [Candidatus Eisenbacteria bacterium]
MFAIARSGNTIYVGGNFATVGPASGGGVLIDPRTASCAPACPKVAGKVNAVVADDRGGWYIAGLFSSVGGTRRGNIARISATGAVEAWSAETNDEVQTLALQGPVLYVGGKFTSVANVERQHLAALSTEDGELLDWNPVANDWVMTLLAQDRKIYAGGLFTNIGGQARNYVAALDSSTGHATTWDAGIDSYPGVPQRVLALALDDSTLFVGGRFVTVRGTPRRHLAAVNTLSGTLTPWDAGVERRPDYNFDGGPRVSALLVRGSTLYVGGSFKVIGGAARQGLAALDITTGLSTSWDPKAVRDFVAGAYFNSFVAAGDTLFVAGEADSLGGSPSSYLAALSTRTGERFSWDPRPNWEISTLALADGVIYAGGAFTSMGPWVRRHDLAAFDAVTGKVTPWAPEPDYTVQDIVVQGGVVYVGGSFSFVGGQPRTGIAALDSVSGLATPWNPGVNGTVYSLAPWRGTMLLGGSFGAVGGQPRRNIAAIDETTGLPTPWNPNADDIVYTIVPGDSVIYVGGWFGSIGGQVRASLAAIDPQGGFPTTWTPSTDGIVNKIAILGGTIFVGGEFNFVNGQQRDGLAAISSVGDLTPWSANASRRILALAASDSTVYAGGGFSFVGGEPRFCIAALNAHTGAVREWYPTPDGIVWCLAATDTRVYAGGAFARMGVWPQASFAVMTPADYAGPGTLPTDFFVQSAPNPARESAMIRYTLPVPATVTMTVFDLHGRVVACPLSGASQTAGLHQVPLSTSDLRPGCYFYRLEAGRLSATRKMVVIR